MIKNLIGESWYNALSEKELACLYEKYSIIEEKRKTQEILPYENSESGIYHALKITPFDKVKVLIIGQDPYPQKGVATGLAFANSSDTPEESYSPSLGILRESVIDFTIPHRTINFAPDLEKWEEQGVLLLNSALSCQLGKPESHALMWRPFISSFSGIVYVLMGSQAQSFEHCINANNNYIIHCRHPSWYARTHQRMPSDIWRQVNEIMVNLYDEKINWFDEN